ncbi:MAG: hypothetical protein MR308_09300 [Lachnospiraceae bacterium]|nr:hypothetical protein [Lachnospiraceae bacterium]
MTNRQRLKAVLHYESYDRIPVVSFGFWTETLQKWCQEGHIPKDQVYDRPMADGEYEQINRTLGFDFNWHSLIGLPMGLLDPVFEETVLEKYPDGKQKIRNKEGSIVIVSPNIVSIPKEVGHTLVDRKSWEEHYIPRLSYGKEALDLNMYESLKKENETREEPLGIFCGSLLGRLRNWLGLMDFSFLWYDDPELFTDIVNTIGDTMYRQTKNILETGVQFDFAHFWEDVCGNDGPLVLPEVVRDVAGPHYKKITNLLKEYNIDIVSLDCDGCIDQLVPIWLENGVNTMFPIEVGRWNASIGPWREKYGKSLLGVGGMNKKVFAQDYAAIDKEIERMKPFIEMGGFIPCPDHRIAPDAKWENVQYYCDKMHELNF